MTVGFTEYFILASTAAILIVDLFLFIKGGDKNTISNKFAVWSVRIPLVPFLAGLLIGHLFWPNSGYCP